MLELLKHNTETDESDDGLFVAYKDSAGRVDDSFRDCAFFPFPLLPKWRDQLAHTNPTFQARTSPQWLSELGLWLSVSDELHVGIFGALSPVNQKGLYQGWKQASIYPLVIHSTRHHTTSLLFSNHNSNYTHNFGTQTQKNNNTCFGAHLYSAGTQHRNLHQLSVTMSMVIYFILRVHTGTSVSHS